MSQNGADQRKSLGLLFSASPMWIIHIGDAEGQHVSQRFGLVIGQLIGQSFQTLPTVGADQCCAELSECGEPSHSDRAKHSDSHSDRATHSDSHSDRATHSDSHSDRVTHSDSHSDRATHSDKYSDREHTVTHIPTEDTQWSDFTLINSNTPRYWKT